MQRAIAVKTLRWLSKQVNKKKGKKPPKTPGNKWGSAKADWSTKTNKEGIQRILNLLRGKASRGKRTDRISKEQKAADKEYLKRWTKNGPQ